ncbi:Hypothetical protein HDN1F_29910 [gamma proteobacterium HdN1]|nr:Hypothetical protein HDN1F_29910 [gamma proteobacterium HdN1]
METQVKKLVLAIALMPFLISCTKVKPSDEQVTSLIVDRLNDERNEAEKTFVEFGNIKKENGYFDNNMYVAEVTYDRTYTQGINDIYKEMVSEAGRNRDAQRGVTLIAAQLLKNYGEFSKGDVIKYSAKVRFVESEKGWIIAEKM